MPSPGRPKTTSTPQSTSLSTRTSEAVLLIRRSLIDGASSSRGGQDLDQSDDPPTKQDVDRKRDQRRRLENVEALGRVRKDAPERGHQRPGHGVDERHEIGLRRGSRQLQDKPHGDQNGDQPGDEPHDLYGAVVVAGNGRPG